MTNEIKTFSVLLIYHVNVYAMIQIYILLLKSNHYHSFSQKSKAE